MQRRHFEVEGGGTASGGGLDHGRLSMPYPNLGLLDTGLLGLPTDI